MPTVQVYRDDEFPPVLKWQAIAFKRILWPFAFQGPGRYAATTSPPERQPVHIVAVEGEALLSYAALIPLTLTHAGSSYTVSGFSSMFTFPPDRRAGLGRRVVDCATHVIRERGADLGLLFCNPALAPFYAASGWEAVRAPTYVGAAGQQHPYDALTMALYASEKGQRGKADFDDQPLAVEKAW